MSACAAPQQQSSSQKAVPSRLPAFLYRRGRQYYFKRKVPVDCREVFSGRKQVWKSLDTDLLERAKVMLAVEVTEFDLAVARHRKEMAARTARSADAQGEEDRPRQDVVLASGASGGSVPNPQALLQGIEATLQHLRALLASSAGGAVSPPPELPCRPPLAQASKPAAAPVARGRIQPTMLHLFEDWKRKQSRPRTVGAVRHAVLEFHEMHGSLPVENISRQHVRAYRDLLVERRLSAGTVENRLGFLSTLIRHGQLEMVEHLTANPFERIEIAGGEGLRVRKDRRAFTVAELNQVYASRLYTADERPRGQAAEASYWAPLMGPFVGARIEEVAQLRIEDVQRINGSWSLRICDLDDQQQLKNPGSFRRVPIHKVLIKVGFLRYVAEQARVGADRVFPSLSNDNANRIWSNSLGKWWARFLDGIGLDDPRLDYHSFRYSFRQQCSLCGIENETRDALTGHWVSNSDAGRTYLKAENRQYPYPKLVAAMEQLRYDELRVAHLFVDEPMDGVDEALLR